MVTSVSAAGSAPSRVVHTAEAQPTAKAEDSTTSFSQKLAGALQEFLYSSRELSNVEFEIQTIPGQNGDARQFVVTVKATGTATVTSGIVSAARQRAPATPVLDAPAAPVPQQPVYTLMGIPRPPASATTAPSPIPTPAPSGPRLASGKAVTNEYEAYWASQPPEVQELMSIDSELLRGERAHELADRGYIIDVPIMLWGWDPLSTMTVRKNQGFTWVPSAKMVPVSVAPGLDFPGLISYDAKNPPPGAILVSTDFAKGFEHTSPWMRYEEMT